MILENGWLIAGGGGGGGPPKFLMTSPLSDSSHLFSCKNITNMVTFIELFISIQKKCLFEVYSYFTRQKYESVVMRLYLLNIKTFSRCCPLKYVKTSNSTIFLD